VKNESGKFSKIDLELFFNGVTNGTGPLLEAINQN